MYCRPYFSSTTVGWDTPPVGVILKLTAHMPHQSKIVSLRHPWGWIQLQQYTSCSAQNKVMHISWSNTTNHCGYPCHWWLVCWTPHETLPLLQILHPSHQRFLNYIISKIFSVHTKVSTIMREAQISISVKALAAALLKPEAKNALMSPTLVALDNPVNIFSHKAENNKENAQVQRVKLPIRPITSHDTTSKYVINKTPYNQQRVTRSNTPMMPPPSPRISNGPHILTQENNTLPMFIRPHVAS